jgi:hypothetical protein
VFISQEQQALRGKFTICETKFLTPMATKIAVFWGVVQSGRNVLTLEIPAASINRRTKWFDPLSLIFVNSFCLHGPVACKSEIEIWG